MLIREMSIQDTQLLCDKIAIDLTRFKFRLETIIDHNQRKYSRYNLGLLQDLRDKIEEAELLVPYLKAK